MVADKPHKAPLFPLIRHLSMRVSPALVRLPVSANLVTTASLLTGISACWYFAQGTWIDSLIGSGLFLICYIFDNCDGEVARAKNLCSAFGREYDTFVDWLVHSLFFACLGWGVTAQTGADFWFWLGLFAAFGGTINYLLGIVMTIRERTKGADAETQEAHVMPIGPVEWFAYALRELSRADFWVIVIGLSLFDVTWLLLPAGAAGAHAYWLAMFVNGARQFKA